MAVTGCGSPDGPQAAAEPDAGRPDDSCPLFDYSSWDGGRPVASFSADVAPILERSCSFEDCHGAPSAAASPRDFLVRYVGTMGETSDEIPLITAAQPGRSLLMHKLDATQACAGLSCAIDGCGGSMPPGLLLDRPERDVIRRWIYQGAKAD